MTKAARDFSNSTTVKAGELLILTDGEYSDYCIILVAKVLEDIDFNKEFLVYNKNNDLDNQHRWLFNSDRFVMEQLKDKIELIEHREINLETDR